MVWRTCPGGGTGFLYPSFTLVFSTTGGMGGEALTFYPVVWPTCFLATAQHLIVALWHEFAAHCHFHCFVLLQCASGEHDPSFIDPTMLPRKWAILLALGTFSCPLSVVQHTCFLPLVLGVVGKGSTSSPRGKKIKK